MQKDIKHPLTDYGIKVRSKLIELNKTQAWLIDEIKKETRMFVDCSLLNKILTGRVKSERITAAIDSILNKHKYILSNSKSNTMDIK